VRGAASWIAHARGRDVLNPLRSEDEAFRFLLYAIVAIVAIVLILRAIF